MSEQKKITLPGSLAGYVTRADDLRSNGFDVPVHLDRMAIEARRVGSMLSDATPPDAMRIAPVAPARGAMRLLADFEALPGGTRRKAGAHWQELSPLAAMVAQAAMRHEGSGRDMPFVAPFTPGQVQVAEDYRALVEAVAAGLCKGSSLEGGRSGGGSSGLAIDSYMDQSRWLAELRRRIGTGAAMQPRRNMDRDNARRSIPVAAVVDMVLLQGLTLSDVLRRYGWAEKGLLRKDLRNVLCAALDRMQGYRDA